MPPSVTPRLRTGAPVRRHVPLLRVRFVMARVAAALFIATVGAAFAPRARADCWDVAANRYRLRERLIRIHRFDAAINEQQISAHC